MKGGDGGGAAAPAASLAAAACWSLSKSTLRGSNRVGIWPGTVRAIRVNHLGQEWDTGGALSCDCNGGGGPGRRESAGVRGFGRCNGLQATRTSAGERGGRSVLTKGLGRPDFAAQGTGGEVQAAKMTRSSGRSRCERPWVPGFPWFASWSCCGDATGVRAGCGLPAASNRAGGATYRRRVLVEIRRVQAGGRGQQARGRSWARGGAPAVVGRGWEAVAWPVRGGAGARWSRAAWRRR